MSSFDYCTKCGKLLNMYKPEHDCSNDKESILEWGNMLLSEARSLEAHCFDLEEIIKDPPVYSIPFLGNPAPEVQDYIKRMDEWYCKLLKVISVSSTSRKIHEVIEGTPRESMSDLSLFTKKGETEK